VLFGSALWLAKQMNLIEFVEAADELFARQQIELWVVGRVPDHMQGRKVRATRFLGFLEDPQPIFRTARMGIVPERTGGGFKLKTLDYIFNRIPIAALNGSTAGLPLMPGLHYLSFQSIPELAQGVAGPIAVAHSTMPCCRRTAGCKTLRVATANILDQTRRSRSTVLCVSIRLCSQKRNIPLL
jgi:hypothetical protein